MKQIESTGKTLEEALDAGLKRLGCTIGDVTWTPLQEGAKGLFGLFGSRPAKVLITLREEDEADDDLTKGLLSSLIMDTDRDDGLHPESERAVPERATPVRTTPERTSAPAKPLTAPKTLSISAAKSTTRAKDSPQPNPEHSLTGQSSTEQSPTEPPKAAPFKTVHSKPLVPKKPTVHAKREAVQPNKQTPSPHKETAHAQKEIDPMVLAVPAPEEPPIQHPADTPLGAAQQFLQQLTGLMGVQVQVYADNDEEQHLYVRMHGDTLGVLIGRRGETLDALQYLTSLVVNRKRDDYIRVTLDTENYRAKREEALRRLAMRMASRVVKTGRRVVMEPMNPYERRILHASLQGHSGVVTHSEGEEPNRRIIISLKKPER